MKKHLTSLSLIALSFGIISCGSDADPQKPETPNTVSMDNPGIEAPEHVPVDEDIIAPDPTEADQAQTVIKAHRVVRGYPVAHAVEGRPGHVYNPFNQNMVDVTGIESLSLVADPNDSDPKHQFRVP